MKYLKTYEGFKYLKPKSEEEIKKSIIELINNSDENISLSKIKELPEGFENYTFNNKGDIYLNSLITLPKGIIFNNKGSVTLYYLKTLPEGVKFNNKGYVHLQSLTNISKGVEFNNNSDIYLRSFTTLPEGVIFNNKGYRVYLKNETINIE